jgi:hypothetical protein
MWYETNNCRPEIAAFGGIPGTVSPTMHTPHFDALAAGDSTIPSRGLSHVSPILPLMPFSLVQP